MFGGSAGSGESGEGTGRAGPPPSEPPHVTGEAQCGQWGSAFRGGPAAPPTPPSRPGRQPADAHLELVLVGTRLLCGGRPRGAQALLQVTHGDELAGCEGTTAGVWNTGGYFSRPPSSASHPGARWPAGPWGGPSGGPCPRTVWTPSPGACSARQPEALTGLSDGDGEAVAVGAALGLDGHVAGGVTCRRGRARQARGAEPLPARPTPQLRQGSQGRLLRGPQAPSCRQEPRVSLLGVRGTHRRRGTDTDRMPGLHGRSHK